MLSSAPAIPGKAVVSEVWLAYDISIHFHHLRAPPRVKRSRLCRNGTWQNTHLGLPETYQNRMTVREALRTSFCSHFLLMNMRSSFPKLTLSNLQLHDVLQEPGQKIKFGYFPNTAMSSVLNLMADGKCVEVGLVGTEGMVGLPLMANLNSSPNLTVIQAPGTLFRINVQEFKAILPDCPQLNRIGTLCSSCCPGDNADCRLQSPASATARMPRSVLTEPKPPVESPSWSRRKC